MFVFLLGLPLLNCAVAIEVDSEVDSFDTRWKDARASARLFLDSLAPNINPLALRKQHEMKGIKFLVEYLNAYRLLLKEADSKEALDIKKHIQGVLSSYINSKDYHAFSKLPDSIFKSEIISYLSAATLLPVFGLENSEYKKSIAKILPRVFAPAHMSRRGVDNTMAISYNLHRLGFIKEKKYCEQYQRQGSVLREHPDLTKLNFANPMERARVYDLTHEVFYLTNYGKTPPECLKPTDKVYARIMISKLIDMLIVKNKPDLVAELLVCLDYLVMIDVPQYERAADYILDKQNADGSWGDYRKEEIWVIKNRPKYLVKVGQYLHTTQVSLWALSLVSVRSNNSLS